MTQLLVSYADDIKRKGLSLALPLATDSLLNTDFQRDLTETVRASSLPPRALLFSVDEAVVLEHAAQCRACLRELQQLGCRLIVNGFGHNINAFDELGDQKIDIIRIDERFITNVHCNQMDELMVSMLNGAAHRIKAQTLAGPGPAGDAAGAARCRRRSGRRRPSGAGAAVGGSAQRRLLRHPLSLPSPAPSHGGAAPLVFHIMLTNTRLVI